MKKRKSGTIILVAVFAAITILHLAYRISNPAQGDPLAVSTFPEGADYPRFAQFALQTAAQSEPIPERLSECRIVVVFSSKCPFCYSAAKMEAVNAQEERLPTTWMTIQNDSAAVLFGSNLSPEVQSRYAPDVMTALKVQAVPAAFLIDGRNTVRRVWVYQGDEDHQALRRKCA